MELKQPFAESVAKKLIGQLKAGTAPWQKELSPGETPSFLPMNPTTGKRYKGINALHLMAQNRQDSRWVTYKQATSLGAQVRGDEKGTPIQYWIYTEEQAKLDDKGKPLVDEKGQGIKETVELERPRECIAVVFNGEQIDGLEPLPQKTQRGQPPERAESLLKACGVLLHHGPSSQADTLPLPPKEPFANDNHYYATALRELGHWTGHASRLNRDVSHPPGSEGYAKEELRTEIAAMILGNELGVGHHPKQNPASVRSWIKVLEDDPLEILRVASEAEKIHDAVLALEQNQVQQQDQGESQETGVRPPKIEADVSPRSPLQYLTVPYEEKEEAKGLGARWDPQQQSWYLPPEIERAPFAKWMQGAALGPTEGRAEVPDPKERVYLAVPYGRNGEAKAAGALWDKSAKSWYMGPQAAPEKLEHWKPHNVPIRQRPALTPREEFGEALRLFKCEVTGEHPLMDGQKHRIRIEGDKKGEQSGFYVGYLNGHPAGYIKNNRTGLETTWKAKGYSLDSQEKAKIQADASEKFAQRVAEKELLQEAAAKRVSQQMNTLVPIDNPTPYLQAKGLQATSGVLTDQDGHTTFIPGFDVEGRQWTTQYIQEDGTKRFAKDSRKEGCFHPVGGMKALASAQALVIAEGYSTAASLSEALGQPTVAAFDTGNLLFVARALQEKFPDKPIIIAGDDDRHLEATQGINPGRLKAEETAKAVGGKVIFPTFATGEQTANPKAYTDFNDVATKSKLGKEGVKRQVNAAFSKVIQDETKRKTMERKQQEKQQRPKRVVKI